MMLVTEQLSRNNSKRWCYWLWFLVLCFSHFFLIHFSKLSWNGRW